MFLLSLRWQNARPFFFRMASAFLFKINPFVYLDMIPDKVYNIVISGCYSLYECLYLL